MNQTTPDDDDMPAGIDFSGGKRGQFQQAGARLNLPVYLDQQVQATLAALASAKGVELSALVNDLLKKDIELIGLALSTRKLPPNRLAEAVDFVDFLAAREERQAAGRRLGESMAKLDALNLPPLTADEVEGLVQESRRERRREADDEAPSFPLQRP